MNPIEPIRATAIERVHPHRRVAERPRDEEEPGDEPRREHREGEPEDEAADDGLPHLDVRI